MKEIRTNELRAGHEVTAFFTVMAMARKKSRNEQNYLVFELMWDSGFVKGYLWGAVPGMRTNISPGCCVKVKGYVKSINNVNLIEIKRIWPATEAEMYVNSICYRPLVASRAGERTRQLSLWPDSEEDPA